MAETILSAQSLTALVSKSQLSGIVSDIVKLLHDEDTAVTNAYKALIGTLGKVSAEEGAADHTVKSYVDAAIASVNGDNSALAGRVDTLEANAETVGSVKYMIAQEFNDFVTKTSNDQIVNTFKEMIDYVAAHGTEYANLAALVGTIPEGASSTTVVAYALEVANAVKAALLGTDSDTASAETIKGLGKRSKAIEDRLDVIEGEGAGSVKKALQDAKDYADGLAGNYDENGAAAAVQGNTTLTVADVASAINGFAIMTDADVAEIKALIK